MTSNPTFRHSRRLATTTVAVLVAVLVGAAVAVAAGPAITTITPRHADDITNIDVLRQQIRNYYGDPLGSGVFTDDSNYAKEARSVAEKASHYLARKMRHEGQGWFGWQHGPGAHGIKAIVLDVDDTTLATWNYEIFSNWAFNSGTNADFVLGQKFPAVPGMVDMVRRAKDLGYAIFFLTGRPAAQEAATLGNLTTDDLPAPDVDAGYPTPTTLNDGEDGLFTKPPVDNDYAAYPDYLKAACADEISQKKSCTTTHYKSATRQHIESLGYDIVANVGDQFSDLVGGFADKTFKMPNPNYFLP